MNWRTNQSLRKGWWKAGLLLPGLLSGCSVPGPYSCHVDNCANVPPGAQPAPNGTYVRRFREIEAAKAEADDFVIYKHEWYMGGNELGPYGTYHVNEIVKRLPFVPFPVMLQAHNLDGELNEERRQYIVNILKLNGVPEADMRVLVGFPDAEGLYGNEAERVYLQLLSGQDTLGRGGLGGAGGFSPFGSRFNQVTPFGSQGSFGGFSPYSGGGFGGGRPGGVFGF